MLNQPITNEGLRELGLNPHISYWIETSKGKQLSIAHNDLDKWYAFFRNVNRGEVDDLVCLRDDLKYIHEVELLYTSITGRKLKT